MRRGEWGVLDTIMGPAGGNPYLPLVEIHDPLYPLAYVGYSS
jgi:hypothetical protein